MHRHTTHLLSALIIAGLFSGFGISGCKQEPAQDPKSAIIGKWKLTEFTPAKQFEMSDSIRQKIIESTMIEYKADKTFTQTGIGRTHAGTFLLSDDGKLIFYEHTERNARFVENVLEFTDDKLSVTDQNGNKMTRKKVE